MASENMNSQTSFDSEESLPCKSHRAGRVGYATGVFDMFHVGHLNLLRRAKAECDYLIVGVTTDELAFELKGRKPIVPFEERMEVVKYIRLVDEVVPEFSNDKISAWEELRFNVTFKGDDWQGSEKWRYLTEEFALRKVDVIFFPYTVQTSSTILRKALGA